MTLFGELGDALKPGEAGRLALERELERRVAEWGAKPGYAYRGGGDFLLRHGRHYPGRELPERYEELIGEPTQCFPNALSAVQRDPALRYCEGVYAVGVGHYTPHAWALDADDAVVEVTYPTRGLERRISARGGWHLDPKFWSYWGVIVHPEYVQAHMEQFGLPMLDRGHHADERFARMLGVEADYREMHDFPILKVPYDANRTEL